MEKYRYRLSILTPKEGVWRDRFTLHFGRLNIPTPLVRDWHGEYGSYFEEDDEFVIALPEEAWPDDLCADCLAADDPFFEGFTPSGIRRYSLN